MGENGIVCCDSHGHGDFSTPTRTWSFHPLSPTVIALSQQGLYLHGHESLGPGNEILLVPSSGLSFGAPSEPHTRSSTARRVQ